MSVRLACLLSAALIGGSLIAPAFGATHHTPAKTSAHGSALIWRGDVTTGHGVVEEVARIWQSSGHGSIELQPFNTASGIDAVASGTADLAGSARGSDGSAEDSHLTFTPVAWDGLVMITQASNPVRSLTLQQLHDIYYGKITNWSEVGGKDAPIDLYAVASPGDGVEYSLRSLLFGRGDQAVAAPRLYLNTKSLEAGVGLDPNSLGVVGMSSAISDPKVRMIPINGVEPSPATVASGSYVLYTPLYLITNASSPKAAQVQEFIDFVQSSSAKAALRKHGLLPFQDGMALASMDSSRRAKILAQTGGHAAPQAAVASLAAAAAAPAYAPSAALAARTPVPAREAKPALTDLSGGVVAAPAITSLKGVTGGAITVAAAGSRGSDFAKVTADVYVTHHRLAASNKKTAQTEKQVAPKQQVASQPAARTYRVVAGETLYSIARRHNVDVAQIRAWNHLKDNTVKVGQELRVSAR
jgi:phosphate transport system substrate-binding protein